MLLYGSYLSVAFMSTQRLLVYVACGEPKLLILYVIWYLMLTYSIRQWNSEIFFRFRNREIKKGNVEQENKREKKRRKENRTIQTWEVKQRKWITRKQGLGKWTLFREKTRPVFEKMFTRSNFCVHGYTQSRCKGDLTFVAHHCTERHVVPIQSSIIKF